MFQGLNQLIVLTTLLLVGLEGLAAPTRRQDGYYRIRNANLDLCAAVFDPDSGTQVEFDDCERHRQHHDDDDEDDEDEYNQGATHPARVQGCIVSFDFTNTAGRQHIVVSA